MKEEMLLKVAEIHLEKGGKLINFHGISSTPVKSLSLPVVGNIFYRRKDKSCSNLIVREK